MLEELLKNIGGKSGLGDKVGHLMPMVMQQIQQQGGLPGLLQKFQANGLGDKAASWVSTGENQPVSAEEAKAALGDDFINNTAQQLGVDPSQISEAASHMVPAMVDQATPDGQVPEGHGWMDNLKGMAENAGLGNMLGGLLK